MTGRATAAFRGVADERGVVLPLAMMVLLILVMLSTALIGMGGSEVFIANNHLRGTQALSAAEAGLEHAYDVFRGNTALLSPAAPIAALTAVPGLAASGTKLGTIGSYVVQYRSAGTDTIELVSTGASAIGSGTRVLRATLTAGTFTSDDAVRTQKDLKISGNPTITGACGSAHTNGNLDASGNPTATGGMTASGTFANVAKLDDIGTGSGGGKPTKPIPVIDPTQVLIKAQASVAADQLFQMKSDGTILDGNGNVLATLKKGDQFNGWKYDGKTPAQWDLSGNAASDGTYYIEGSAKVSGNPGSLVAPWTVSIIATGDVEISGNPEMKTHFGQTFVIAGADVKISGNPNQQVPGLIAAHEQIHISGNPTINGFVIAEDAASASNTEKENQISGNPTIKYDCGVSTPFPGGLQILTWGS
jgi:Tfp pilus assembly protein PilX